MLLYERICLRIAWHRMAFRRGRGVLCKQILKHSSHLNIFVVKSHSLLLSAMSNELSFCLFMRHSNGYLWARCHVLWLDLWSWPWLHIYTGMLNDSLSHCQYPTCTWTLRSLRSERLIRSSCSVQSISTCVCIDADYPASASECQFKQWEFLCCHLKVTAYAICHAHRRASPFFPSEASSPVLEKYKGLFADVR